MKKNLIFLSAFLFSLCFYAQNSTTLDGAYIKENTPTKQVIQYPHLREADVMWSKRVWQVIDLRQKMNHKLYFPLEAIEDRKSLFDVIRYETLINGSLTAYGLGPTDDDDEFRFVLSHEELDDILNPEKEIMVQNLLTGDDEPVTVPDPVTSVKITKYQIKEDWLFDKQRSERYVRIIGIMPMMEDYDDEGALRGHKPLFWIYYPYARYTFVNYEVFNSKNGAQRMSFDDLFQKRLFDSYVVKEENVYNRTIQAYSRGVDALLESAKIKTELFRTEHDLWSY